MFFDADTVALRHADAARTPPGARCWARRRLTGVQAGLLAAAAAGGVAFAALDPKLASAVGIAAFLLLNTLHLALRMAAWWIGVSPAPQPALRRDDADLPSYSLIVPLFEEAHMIAPLCAALTALDYPHDRLEAILAVEAEDLQTRHAIETTVLPSWAKIVVVPPGDIQTKPRACNYALAEASGEFVVVYDAEDRPEPDQLRKAVAAFDAGGDRLVCLQARLVPYNDRDNALTRLFTLDYCQWFDGMLTGFERLGLPVPLGGTSNHFRTAALKDAGGWDSWNVTEDADLGIRLWRLGLGVGTIESTTFEEAPRRLGVWINQRTRWARGYLQTFLVHSRRPRTLGLPRLGLAGWFFLASFVGGSTLFALVNPLFWFLTAYVFVTGEALMEWAFGPFIAPLAWASLVFGNAAAIAMAMLSPLKRGWWRLAPWGLLTPAYWFLVSYATYRAVIALVFRPFRWEKTPHGEAGGPSP